MMARILPIGSMTKTARTAAVSLAVGWIMPYCLAISIFVSAMSGKVTTTSFMSLYFRVVIVRSQAMWLGLLSTDRPTSWQFIASKSGWAVAKVMNSVVQTGVKSAGWLNRTTHLPAK